MKGKNWIFGLVVIVVAVVAIGIWGFGKSGEKNTTTSNASTASATYFDTNAKVMYFYSDTCHWCLQEKTVLEKLGSEGYKVKPMNVGNDQSLWTTYNISGTPAFIADSGKGDKFVGFKEYEPLKAWLDQHK